MSTTTINPSRSLLLNAIYASDVTMLKELLAHLCQSSDEVATAASEYLLIQKGELLSNEPINDIGPRSKRPREDGDEADEVNGDVLEDEDGDEEKDSNVSSSEGEWPDDGFDEDESEDEDEDEDDAASRAPKRIKLSTTHTGPDAELISRYETCVTCRKRFDVLVNHPEACKTHAGSIEVNYDDETWADDIDVENGFEIDPVTDWRREEFPEGFIWTCCQGIGNARPCRVSRHVAMVQVVRTQNGAVVVG